MKAVVVEPGRRGSLRVTERKEPVGNGALLVEAIAIGICGTDHEIIERGHGEAPEGSSELVLGHESLGRVLEAQPGSGFSKGDLVAGIVRRPDPVPCPACAQNRWDMCLNGGYVERGIKGLDGYASELFTLEPEFAIHVPSSLGLGGVLVEPTSIVVKAWSRLTELAGFNWRPLRSVLVTGAGPIGLLAALLGTQRDLDVHVLDRVSEGVKPALVRDLGASYHTELESCPEPDAVIECTGAASLIPRVIEHTDSNSVVCLTGVSEHALQTVDIGALNRELVLENDVVFGSVNAGRGDYESAISSLGSAEPGWLDRLLVRRTPLSQWSDAYERREDDVKNALVFQSEI